tara:strand:- start:5433 stop:5912 length:480 start_codon:yes stop_codon:yes gene_type:complete
MYHQFEYSEWHMFDYVANLKAKIAATFDPVADPVAVAVAAADTAAAATTKQFKGHLEKFKNTTEINGVTVTKIKYIENVFDLLLQDVQKMENFLQEIDQLEKQKKPDIEKNKLFWVVINMLKQSPANREALEFCLNPKITASKIIKFIRVCINTKKIKK